MGVDKNLHFWQNKRLCRSKNLLGAMEMWAAVRKQGSESTRQSVAGWTRVLFALLVTVSFAHAQAQPSKEYIRLGNRVIAIENAGITTISPASATAGSGAFTLTVNGVGFTATSTVQWNGSGRTTAFVSAVQLTAAINAADVVSAGTATVTVMSPQPGGGTFQGVSFTINDPAPVVTSLSPTGIDRKSVV